MFCTPHKSIFAEPSSEHLEEEVKADLIVEDGFIAMIPFALKWDNYFLYNYFDLQCFILYSIICELNFLSQVLSLKYREKRSQSQGFCTAAKNQIIAAVSIQQSETPLDPFYTRALW